MKARGLVIYLVAGSMAVVPIGNALGQWDLLRTPKECATLQGTSPIACVAFAPNGKTLATANADKTVTLWDTVSGTVIAQLEGHSSPVYSVAFSPDGKTLASGSDDQTIRLWDVKSGKKHGHAQRTFQSGLVPVFQPGRENARLGRQRKRSDYLGRRQRENIIGSKGARGSSSLRLLQPRRQNACLGSRV